MRIWDMWTSLEAKYEGHESGKSLTLTLALPFSTSYVFIGEFRLFCGQGLLWRPCQSNVCCCVRWMLASTDKYSQWGFAKSFVTACRHCEVHNGHCIEKSCLLSVKCCDSVQIMFLWLVATNVFTDSTASLDLVSHEHENISNYSLVQDF